MDAESDRRAGGEEEEEENRGREGATSGENNLSPYAKIGGKAGVYLPRPTLFWSRKRRQEEEDAERKERWKSLDNSNTPHTDFCRSRRKLFMSQCAVASCRAEANSFSSIWSYVLTFSVAHPAAACQFVEQPSGTQRVAMPS